MFESQLITKFVIRILLHKFRCFFRNGTYASLTCLLAQKDFHLLGKMNGLLQRSKEIATSVYSEAFVLSPHRHSLCFQYPFYYYHSTYSKSHKVFSCFPVKALTCPWNQLSTAPWCIKKICMALLNLSLAWEKWWASRLGHFAYRE
jgi:hypothetical protein